MVRLKEDKLQAPKTLNVSRRDALLCVTAEALGGFTILSAVEPAEARVGRVEMKKKIMQKLEKLREENAGISKTKTKQTTNTQSPTKEKILPNPQGPIIEAIIP